MLRKLIARMGLRLVRFRLEGSAPPIKNYVCLAAPHTSNLDGVIMVLFANSLGIKLSWMLKAEAYRFPFRWILNWLGAVPVARKAPQGLVGQLAERLEQADDMVLAIAPAGSRSKGTHWKSGFYHVARAANVPVVPAFLNYEKRTGGFGPVIELTGDVAGDMDRIREFYGDLKARYPDQLTPVRLRDEQRQLESDTNDNA